MTSDERESAMSNYGIRHYGKKARAKSTSPREVSFDRTDEEDLLMDVAVERYARHSASKECKMTEGEMNNLKMTLSACHANGNPLDFRKMMEVEDSTFLHDITGICKNMNVDTGKLRNFFVPRCSSPRLSRV